MRWTRSLIPTLRDDPADAEAISHKLMVRAGLVRQLAAGIYVYLPLGLRVIEKVNAIIRQEMNGIGGQGIEMPGLPPAAARAPARRALAAVRPVGRDRRRDVSSQRPQRTRHVPRHDPRGGHRLARRPR